MLGQMSQTRTVSTKHHDLRIETVAAGLENPWGIALLPDGRFLVTERNSGRLRLGSRDGELSSPIEGTPRVFRFQGDEGSQAGMFDVRLDLDFAANRRIYLSYAKPTDSGAAVCIDRAELDEAGRLSAVTTIFEMNRADQDSSSLHFGGRIAIHPVDGHIFITVGDRRNMNRAQSTHDQAGTVLRMTTDGDAPADNPFFGREGFDPYTYSYGHRNSQGLAFDPVRLDLWENEHGPQGGDELNLIRAGGNYGWPFTTAGLDYSGAPIGVGREMEGMIAPVHDFPGTLAPSGLVVVRGDLFGKWNGDVLNGGLVSEMIARVRIEDGAVVEEEAIPIGRRVRDLVLAADGSIWLVTDHEDGEVLRITPAGG